jgi:hypothetical protein
MSRSHPRAYPKRLKELMGKKSRILTQARTCSDLGMEELASDLWNTAAAHEERIAPLLETLDRHLEAALHRVSAASCYQKGGDLSRAVNLYRAALAGPVTAQTRREVESMLAACVRDLARLPVSAALA